MVSSITAYKISPQENKNEILLRESLIHQLCLEQFSLSNSMLFLIELMSTWPIMTLSKFFSLINFKAFVSFSDLLLFSMPVLKIDSQSFVFKSSE